MLSAIEKCHNEVFMGPWPPLCTSVTCCSNLLQISIDSNIPGNLGVNKIHKLFPFNGFFYQPIRKLAKCHSESTFVLSRSALIRSNERPVWASTLPDSFNNVNSCLQEGDFVFELVQNCCLYLPPTQHERLRMQNVSDILSPFILC